MMTALSIKRPKLGELVAKLVAGGTEVIGPAAASDGGIDYRRVGSFDDLVPGGAMPRRSLKEFFLPATEPLLRWKQTAEGMTITEVPTKFGPRVIVGALPCDAAALPIVDRVMDWDYHDELWFGRRDATTIISMGCDGGDDTCFCTSVGLAPDTENGSDILLFQVDDAFRVEIVTEKGKRFVDANPGFFDAGSAPDATAFRNAAHARFAARPKAEPSVIRQWVEKNFENPMWEKIALRCHGCGACAAVCPTCHCFDIVDEPDGLATGVRRRNWDTCQTSVFTLHASGHNPRHDQCARCRQRVTHKFAIYPSRFDSILCTGCGRCARVCPGGVDLPEILADIMKAAEVTP